MSYGKHNLIVTDNLKRKMRQYNLSLDDVIWAFNHPDKNAPFKGDMYKCTRAYANYQIGVIYNRFTKTLSLSKG